MCRPLGVKTVCRSGCTLRSSLVHVKQPREDKRKKGVTYEVIESRMLSFVTAEEDLRIEMAYSFNEVTAVFLLNNPHYHHTSHINEALSYQALVCVPALCVCVIASYISQLSPSLSTSLTNTTSHSSPPS